MARLDVSSLASSKLYNILEIPSTSKYPVSLDGTSTLTLVVTALRIDGQVVVGVYNMSKLRACITMTSKNTFVLFSKL
jgi:hypothetical protein